jgi:hypothetical protein
MHWMSQDPPPDATAWLEIDDPHRRVGTALSQIYAHYARNEQVTGNVFRDMYLVESMRSFNVPLVEGSFTAMRETLGSAFSDDADLAVRRKAMLSVALSFNTWKTLVRAEGLTNEEAADLMARLVACVR